MHSSHLPQVSTRFTHVPHTPTRPSPTHPTQARPQRPARALARVMLNARKPSKNGCSSPTCPECLDKLEARLFTYVKSGLPMTLVVPSFPFKIPLPSKTLASRADRSEAVAIEAIVRLVDQINAIHAPGASVVIGSDGLVFLPVRSRAGFDLDLDAVKAYANDVTAMIADAGGAGRVRIAQLDDFYTGTPQEMVQALVTDHQPLSRDEVVRRKIASGSPEPFDLRTFYTHDLQELRATGRRADLSGKAIKEREAPALAAEAMYVSSAWSNLLASNYPGALRLSIHPICLHKTAVGQEKLGIRFGESTPWFAPLLEQRRHPTSISPWRSVWIEDPETGEGCRTTNEGARDLGAELVFVNGHPSHYILARNA
jgi:pyoverdine/dityrosine biosynthesis protein Dit1